MMFIPLEQVSTPAQFGEYHPTSLMSRYALESLEDDVRVDDMVRKSVVYVGDANSGSFVPHGTGFITASFIDDFAYQSVVTARHVLEGIGPDVHLRLNGHFPQTASAGDGYPVAK